VLNIAEWQISAGRQVLLRGISGSGKTTLLNILAGLLPPTNGTVWLGEQSLYALRESQRDHLRATAIGYVFQMHHLAPTLSALENVEMPLIFGRRLNGAARRTRALELLADVGLAEFSRHRPVQLSTGQRLRVAVARALAAKPAVVLADEPTAALDVQASANVIALLQDSCRRSGAILIVASHDPALAARFDCVVDLHGGVLDEQMPTGRQKQQLQNVRT
jgi:ABC-type lipoprotein export system ATPase subunit